MYTESSSPAVKGNKAVLMSKTFPAVHSRCMSFYYNMHGSEINALRVFLVTQQNAISLKLWEKRGNQGKNWHKAQLDISSKYDYKVLKNLFIT